MVIGITGHKRSGKDTCADILVNEYGFTKKQFSEPIKTAACNIFGLNYETVNGNDKDAILPEWGITPRDILIGIGTGFFRDDIGKVFPDLELDGMAIWTKIMKNWLINNMDIDIVIPDVRFIDEAEMIYDLGGYIVGVNSPHVIPAERDTTGTESNFDYLFKMADCVINNIDYSIDVLQDAIKNYYNFIQFLNKNY